MSRALTALLTSIAILLTVLLLGLSAVLIPAFYLTLGGCLFIIVAMALLLDFVGGL